MKKFLLCFLVFAVGICIAVGYRYFRSQKTSTPVAVPTPGISTEPTYALVPPSEAVTGELTVIGGHVQKMSRTESEYKEASTGALILTGESIATGEDSLALATVSGIAIISMDSHAELAFTNLFTNNFVLLQKTGKINYQVTKPVSVRALHTLLTVSSGETVVNIIDTDMSIIVKTGTVKFALVDTDNNTKVWTLKAGQRANIDDAERQVFLVQTR